MGFIFNWLKEEFIKLISSLFAFLVQILGEITSNDEMVNALISILSTLAVIVLVVSLILVLIKTVTSDNLDIKQTILNCVGASIFAISFTTITKLIYALSTELTQIVVSSFTEGINQNGWTAQKIIDSLTKTKWGILLDVVLLAFMVAYLSILLIRQIKRAVDILVYQILGFLVVYDLAVGNVNSFGTYVKGIIGLTISQALELIFMYAGLTVLLTDGLGVVLAFCLFAGATKITKIIQQWSYMQGTGGSRGTLKQSVMMTVATVTRLNRFTGAFK